MTEFRGAFFKSASADVEAEYTNGVRALQQNDFNAASRHFVKAAEGGHVSAYHNLSLIWGGGNVSPYDFDLAADCWYKAAAAGHPTAKSSLEMIESADGGKFGTEALAMFAQQTNPNGGLHPQVMICAARYYNVICRQYGATSDVIAYELDAAATSEFDFVHAYIRRTGISRDFYAGGLNRLKTGSAADQITDGLNAFHIAMRQAGVDEKLALMARCSIVGHIIAKSPYSNQAQPLFGTDQFFIPANNAKPVSSKDLTNKKDINVITDMIKTMGIKNASPIIKKFADDGNVTCQIFMSQAGLSIPPEIRPANIQTETEHYTKLAAESGDPGSQFNLAKLYLSKIADKEQWSLEDQEIFSKVKFWHQKAASNGIADSAKILKDFASVGM